MFDPEDDKYEAEQILANLIGGSGGVLRPPQGTDKRMTTIKISSHAHKRLRDIAASFGYTWKGGGNLSLLLEAIGSNILEVKPTTKLR
jgi:hypothetical protein